MGKKTNPVKGFINNIANRVKNRKLKSKLIISLFIMQIIPLFIIAIVAIVQMIALGNNLREIAVKDATDALNSNAIENIERMTTDTAKAVADFLYQRDDDIRYLATVEPSNENYANFINSKMGRVIKKGTWELSEDKNSWIQTDAASVTNSTNKSTNPENDENDGFNYRPPETFEYTSIPLYDEITFVDTNGKEIYKVTSSLSPKVNYPMSSELKDVSIKGNTYVKAETYFEKLRNLKKNDIYVSDVIGAYIGTNYIGMYTPDIVASAALKNGYEIKYNPYEQAYAGMENPNGQRFEGIIRWATPVMNAGGIIIGYVTFALNHDHIMEFVDHITPMNERYTELPNAFLGNYAFIWDYKCRSICHPRHHSITGFDPNNGNPQVPWLEESIYVAWKASDIENWTDYMRILDYPEFFEQSRLKRPSPALTQAGLVGLDGRYLNNAPQCTGWMDLTEDGGSGSFYILWSGLHKLTTAAAIPYYTGQYAPSAENNYVKRGFGFVTIGSGLEYFVQPATDTKDKLTSTIDGNMGNTLIQLAIFTVILIFCIILVAIWLTTFLTNNIQLLINGISHFQSGERQFRFNTIRKDEFGTLADSFDKMADNLVDSVRNTLCITDNDRKIIYMNQHGLDVCKVTLPEIVGKDYSRYSIYPAETEYCPITALLEGREAEAIYLEDTKEYMKGEANYFIDQDGNKIGYIIASVNVTEIQNAKKKAENASKAKGDFLSQMSHEIRTPLNAIVGMTYIGEAGIDIEKKDYCFNRIKDASTHLLGVINDILDISKIEANKFELLPTMFNFEKMLQKIVNIITFRVESKHQNFSVYIDKDIPSCVIGDEQRTMQVILNLLSNAIKFTPEAGSIHLDARLVELDNIQCRIQIKVTDTGIGIKKENQTRVFDTFEQAENSTTRKFGGTGLGLAISKNIVRLMGGEIWVESEIGKGSVFTFTMVVGYSNEQATMPTHISTDWKTIRVLVVDDDKSILDYFSDIAERLELTCDTVGSGVEAIQMIREKGMYDIYFIDWRMPEVDGIELSRRIKQESNNSCTIIMISAAEMSMIGTIAKEAGVDKFLQKPIFPSAISDIVKEYVGGSTENIESVASTETEEFGDYHILIAEDVEINREIIAALLEPTQLKIDFAENGIEAVKLFSNNMNSYDMIFMDVQMPEMDGYEATRNIRKLDAAKAKSIPIVALSANVFKEDIDKCLESGMNDHVGKPLEMDTIIQKLNKYLLNK